MQKLLIFWRHWFSANSAGSKVDVSPPPRAVTSAYQQLPKILWNWLIICFPVAAAPKNSELAFLSSPPCCSPHQIPSYHHPIAANIFNYLDFHMIVQEINFVQGAWPPHTQGIHCTGYYHTYFLALNVGNIIIVTLTSVELGDALVAGAGSLYLIAGRHNSSAPSYPQSSQLPTIHQTYPQDLKPVLNTYVRISFQDYKTDNLSENASVTLHTWSKGWKKINQNFNLNSVWP